MKAEKLLCIHCGYPIEHGIWSFEGVGTDDEKKIVYEVALNMHRQCFYYLLHLINAEYIRFGEAP